MIAEKFSNLSTFSFNNVYIIENRDCWKHYQDQCSIASDLILCIDLGLKKDLNSQGYCVEFLDHLVDKSVLNEVNYALMDFLSNWYKDTDGNNLLLYKGYNIGEALLLDILNSVTLYSHFFFNLNALHSFKYNNLYISVQDQIILDVISDLHIQFREAHKCNFSGHLGYSFPVSQWMNEKLNRTSLKERIGDLFFLCVDIINNFIDLFRLSRKKAIYIQVHHPTKSVIKRILKGKNYKIILSNYTGLKKVVMERRIPSYDKISDEYDVTTKLLQKYKTTAKYVWEFSGIKISDFLYRQIDPIVEKKISVALSKITKIELFFAKNPISLMVPVTHLWLENSLIINYCQKCKIPIFTIINGLLNLPFWKDAKGGDYVNSYSASIKEDYFNNASSAIPLGDPRMDDYTCLGKKGINREVPTIVIGAAGYDLLDMNSYLSFEFDFLFDILAVLNEIREYKNFKIILKVRPNGYTHLYNKLIAEYFSDLQIEVVQSLPFNQVISHADLYLTFYSQTVFEASCIGVPVIYYKKDTQIVDRPFDGKSELVTALDSQMLKNKILDFYNDEPIFNLFLDKNVMEKYIGPLDGENTERNYFFIKSLIRDNCAK